MSRRQGPLAALALIAAVTLISACGSSAPGKTRNSTAASAGRAVKFARCMRSNGVSAFPDPKSGSFTIDAIANGSSLNTSSPAFTQALSACKDLEPSGFTGNGRSSQQQAEALKFARCVRANGVPDFPDPTPNGPLIDTNRIPSADGRGAHSIPGLQAAARKCIAIYSGQLGLKVP